MNMRNHRSRMLTLCLLAGCVLMALVITWEFGSSHDWNGTDHVRRGDTIAEPVDLPRGDFELPPIDAFAELVERPFFSNTRRPYEPPVSAQKKPKAKAVPAPDWALLGTVITAEELFALLWDKRNRQFVRLEPGMDSAGWELVAVAPAMITLKRGNASHQIELPRF